MIYPYKKVEQKSISLLVTASEMISLEVNRCQNKIVYKWAMPTMKELRYQYEEATGISISYLKKLQV